MSPIEKVKSSNESASENTKQELVSLREEIITNPDDPPASSQEKSDTTSTTPVVKFSTWFNTLQTWITNEWNARIRNVANFWLDVKLWKKETLQLWYFGMNEFTQNLEGYFGRHVPNIWLTGMPKLKAIGIVKTTADGVLDAKYGLRYLVSDQMGVDYWRLDVAGNKNGASATFFLWKNIGKKWTNLEMLSDIQFDGQNKKFLAPFTEIQINQQIAKWFNVFMRGEIPGVKYNEGTYLLWVSKKL